MRLFIFNKGKKMKRDLILAPLLIGIGFTIGYVVNGMSVKKQETVVIENDSVCKRVMHDYFNQQNQKKKNEFIKKYMANAEH